MWHVAYASEEISSAARAQQRPGIYAHFILRPGGTISGPVKTAYGEKTIFGHKKKTPSFLIYARSVFGYKKKPKHRFTSLNLKNAIHPRGETLVIIINSKLVYMGWRCRTRSSRWGEYVTAPLAGGCVCINIIYVHGITYPIWCYCCSTVWHL